MPSSFAAQRQVIEALHLRLVGRVHCYPLDRAGVVAKKRAPLLHPPRPLPSPLADTTNAATTENGVVHVGVYHAALTRYREICTFVCCSFDVLIARLSLKSLVVVRRSHLVPWLGLDSALVLPLSGDRNHEGQDTSLLLESKLATTLDTSTDLERVRVILGS